jgi:hypothetical protein
LDACETTILEIMNFMLVIACKWHSTSWYATWYLAIMSPPSQVIWQIVNLSY